MGIYRIKNSVPIRNISIQTISFSVFTVGDSKTVDDTWIPILIQNLSSNNGSGIKYTRNPTNMAANAITVAGMKAKMIAEFPSVTGDSKIVIINLGSNDVSALPAENTWKSDYRTIIDMIFAKWNNSLIYLAKPVRLVGSPPPSVPLAACYTMWAWISDLCNEYSRVFIGMDETNLECGDGYVLNIIDNTHYTNYGKTISVPYLWERVLL